MRIYPLFSSSKGNCYFYGTKKSGILVDCGVSCRQITAALAANSIPPESVKAVFLTHEHGDHIRGLAVFLKRFPVPIYGTAGTLSVIGESLPGTVDLRIAEGTTAIDTLTVTVIPTSHDAAAPCGFRFTDSDGNGNSLAILTDTGTVSGAAKAAVLGASTAIIESNYDPDMLRTGDYPGYLKARIAGTRGHLSNAQCTELAADLIAAGTRNIILAHISENSNTPTKVYETFINGTGSFREGRDYFLKILSPACEPWFCAV